MGRRVMFEYRVAAYVASLCGLALVVRQYGLKASRVGGGGAPSSSSESKRSRTRTHTHTRESSSTTVREFLRLCYPSVFCRESMLTAAIVALMAVRTAADVRMIDLQTRIESAIITRTRDKFYRRMTRFIHEAVPIAIFTHLLKYAMAELQLQLRERVAMRLLERFTHGRSAYLCLNVDTRASGVEHTLTEDAASAAASAVELLSATTKPAMDTVLYAYKLGTTLGVGGPGAMLSYLFVVGSALSYLRAPMARFTALQQSLDADFRKDVSRTAASAEEIAFYAGGAFERRTLADKLHGLINTFRSAERYRLLSGFTDSMLAKYCATAVGFWIVSRPFLGPGADAATTGSRVGDGVNVERYYSSGRMLLNFSQAVSSLVLVTRDVARLSALAGRVNRVFRVLTDVGEGKCYRLTAAPSAGDGSAQDSEVPLPMVFAGATVQENADHIEFDGVPLCTPSGDVLVSSLTFSIGSGDHTVITGPNGAGKSSLFRILRGLWPLRAGTLHRPTQGEIFYVPQRPYLCPGTLRDQLTYPQHYSEDEHIDAQLVQILDHVHLAYLLDRVGGLDAVCDWADVLSGGEKQRVALARLLYARPKFAILDECTSAVSVDVEAQIYAHLKTAGITLLSVSHRKTLWKHHVHRLAFDGNGSATMMRVASDLQDDV